MQASPYNDLIEEKIVEWRTRLGKTEELAAHSREELEVQVESAILQLGNLDERETSSNTLETKNRILQIFEAVDQQFAEHQSKTPFML